MSQPTPQRSIRVPDALWAAAQAKVARMTSAGKDTSVSAEIVRFLERWVQR